MKKKYSTPNLIKAVSLSAAMATLLSSVSPVFAANLAIRGSLVQSTTGTGVSYEYGSHGSIVFVGDDDYCGVDNVIGRGGKQQANLNNKITAKQEFENFIVDQADNNSRKPYGTTTQKVTWQSPGILTPTGAYMGTNTGGSQNILPEAYGVYSFVTGCGAAATGNYSTAFGAGATAKAGGAQAFGVAALASGKASVAMGVSSEASGEAAVAFGGLATASGDRSISIGVDSKAKASGSIAIGSRRSNRTGESSPTREVVAEARNAIAIGTHTYGKGEDSVAIGANAQALVNDGVAVGGASVSRREKGDKGYDPATGKMTTKTDETWKSTAGAFSVGDVGQEAANGKITRQITGVAAGTEDTDAVNVAQLKAISTAASGAWKLSANDTDPTDVNSGSIVDFSVKNSGVGQDNLTIEKSNENKKQKMHFALSDNLKLISVTTGISSMSGDGFIINEGPRMTVDGIDAGNQKITNVADGTEPNDAVNYKQLQEIKNATKTSWQLAVNGGSATAIGPNGTVNFQSAGNETGKNINITKDNDHNVTFDLAENINVMSVTVGESIMDASGFRVDDGDGPSITVQGIYAGNKTIKGIAEAEEDTDAVNFGQLQKYVEKNGGGWKLSVDGKDVTDVKAWDTVDLIAAKHKDKNNEESGTTNIKIVKGEGNKVSFDLGEVIKVGDVVTGKSHMADNGFIITDGPSMTTGGIHAGNKIITGVQKGTNGNDAVNVSQLQEVKELAEQGWSLSVDGKNATDVKAGGTVDFIAGETRDSRVKNIQIQKDNVNKVTFSLMDQITLVSVTTGNSIMSNDGFKFVEGNGPEITLNGINAGNKKITGVQAGESDTDAVNFSQLNKIKDQIEGNSLVKWDKNERLITIGKEKGGTKIDITGSDEERTIAGVKDGKISEESYEAINGGQINKISKDVAKFFGGGTEFNNGEFSGPKYVLSHVSTNGTVERKEFENVGDALTGLDANVKNVNSRLTYVTNDFNQKFDKFSQDALLWSDAKQAFVALHKKGDETTESKITSLLNGDIFEDSTDAINGSQIHSIGSDLAKFFGGNISFENGKFTGPEYELKIIEEDGPIAIKRYDNVGSALDAVNTNVFTVDHRITVGFLDIADYFGGGAKYEKGKWQAPTFKVYKINADGSVSQQPYDNVADAFEGVNNTFTNIHNQISDIKENNLVQQEEKSGPITIGAKTGGGIINIANNEGSVRIISGVSGGKITEDSTDAVNGSQIHYMGSEIANYFGGGASYENGEWSAPTFHVYHIDDNGAVSKEPYQNVAEAFEGVNDSFTQIHNKISNITENSLVKQDGENGLITVGKATGGTKINIANKNNQERTLSGVKDGELSQNSTEAVNGSQLFKMNEKVTTVTDNLSKVAQNTSKYFGGNTDVLAGIEPSFLIQDKAYNNVTDAFTGVNTSITNIDNKITEMKENNLVQQEGISGIITIGAKTAGTEINIAGYGKVARSISGVKAAEKGDEAVNKDQLDKSIEKISNDIEIASAAAVLYDKNEDGTVNYNSVTLGGEKGAKPVALLNVKDGKISQDSHDAINGSQINKISEDIAKFFGGGAKFVDGAFKGLKYTLSAIVEGQVGKANFYDVGSALTGLDKNVQDVNQRLTKVSNEFNQTIEGISKDALLWDDKEGAFVARHEKDGKKTNSKLKYLLDGNIAEGSTDAITGNQLYLMSNKLANYFGGGAKYENGKWTDPTFKISKVNENGETVETEHNNVADAFGDINDGMSNINNRIDDVINKVDSDALKWNEDKKAYDANRDGKPSKITGVADGEIAESSKDAVNGGQLWKTNERITGVEKDVKHISNRVDNISNTIADIGDTVLNIDAKVDNIDNKVNDIAEDAVRYDRDENGKKINKITLKGGDPSEPVLIDNVADGKIEKGSKEAVNGGQLHDYTQEQMKLILDESKHYTDQRVNNIVIDAIDDAVERSKQYTDMKFDALNYSIESVKKEARQAAAIGLAVSNLRYNDTPGKLSVGFGTGLWRSQSAFAFGAGYTSEKGNIRSNVSVTTSGGHWGVGAGFNMTLN